MRVHTTGNAIKKKDIIVRVLINERLIYWDKNYNNKYDEKSCFVCYINVPEIFERARVYRT